MKIDKIYYKTQLKTMTTKITQLGNLFLTVIISISIVPKMSSQFMEPNILSTDANEYTSSFIAHWGQDTASIETYTIVGNNLFGKAIHLYPEPHMRQFSYFYNTDGSMRSMDVLFYSLNNTSIPLKSKHGLPYRIQMNSFNELVDFRVTDGEGEKQFTHYSKRMDFFGGWIPIIAQWQVLVNTIKENKLNKNLKFLNHTIGDYPMDLKVTSDSTIVFNSDILQPITIYIDDSHKIKKIDAIGTPWNYIIKRHNPIDLEGYCGPFAAKAVIGNPSPLNEISTKIGNTDLSIRYGRPFKRGREIFGSLVPFNRVWRTGAGLPTFITISNDIKINNTVIPKGAYNIFTIPGKSKWKLIFNTEKEAWGSAYHKEYDFAQVEMDTKYLGEIVDQFTISINPIGKDEGLIKMSWDNTQASVSFKVIQD